MANQGTPTAIELAEHYRRGFGELGILAASHAELVKALEAIGDGETRCECDHLTDDCCNKVGEFCPFCIAAAALKAAGR